MEILESEEAGLDFFVNHFAAVRGKEKVSTIEVNGFTDSPYTTLLKIYPFVHVSDEVIGEAYVEATFKQAAYDSIVPRVSLETERTEISLFIDMVARAFARVATRTPTYQLNPDKTVALIMVDDRHGVIILYT